MATKTLSIRLSVKDSDVVRRALMQLGADGQKALQRIEGASKPASKGLLAVNAVSRELQGSMTAFGGRIGAVGSALMALGPAGLAAAAGLGGVVAGIAMALRRTGESLRQLDTLEDVAAKLGIGIEALQEYQFAAEQAGIRTETFNMALQRFTRRAAEAAQGQGEAKAALKQLGIELTDAHGRLRPAEDLLLDLADALAGLEDQGERVRLAFKLFDSEGVALVNMLQRGRAAVEEMRAEARELGIVLDERLVRGAGEANDRLAAMQRIVDVQLSGALVDLAPVLVSVAEGFAEVARFVAEVVDGFREIERMSTRGLEARLGEIEGQLGRLDEALPRLEKMSRGGLIDQAFSALSDLLPGVESFEEARARRDALREEAARIIAELATREAESAQRARRLPPAGTVSTAETGPDVKVLDKLRDQLRLGLLPERERFIEEAVGRLSADATATQRSEVERLAAALFDQKQAQEALQEAIKRELEAEKEGTRLKEKHRSATQAFADEVRQLEDLRRQGAIDAETYARAYADAEERKPGLSRVAGRGGAGAPRLWFRGRRCRPAVRGRHHHRIEGIGGCLGALGAHRQALGRRLLRHPRGGGAPGGVQAARVQAHGELPRGSARWRQLRSVRAQRLRELGAADPRCAGIRHRRVCHGACGWHGRRDLVPDPSRRSIGVRGRVAVPRRRLGARRGAGDRPPG